MALSRRDAIKISAATVATSALSGCHTPTPPSETQKSQVALSRNLAFGKKTAPRIVVVGGGFSGLSAAYHFNRLNPSGRVLILDNHPIFGGEAKRNDFDVNGFHISGPQGSNDFGIPTIDGGPDDYFSALNMPREFNYLEPGGSASGMRIPIDNYDWLTWQERRFDVGHFFQDETPVNDVVMRLTLTHAVTCFKERLK